MGIMKALSLNSWTEFRACNECDGEVLEISSGDEGWSICQDCSAVEAGDTLCYINEDGERITEEEYEKLQAEVKS